MSQPTEGRREGSLQAPTRHPLAWRDPGFYKEEALMKELGRVFDICHGCRRCVSLCNAFPSLFDLIDNSPTLEMDGVKKEDYWRVVDHCYLCDLCFMTKCPYVPPHEWNVDFPHLMLRAKAVKFRKGDVKKRDKLLTNTDMVGKLAGIPVVVQAVNAANRTKAMRKMLDKVLGVHPEAVLPEYHSNTLRKRMKNRNGDGLVAVPAGRTRGKVALFATCYGNYNEPHVGEDLIAVFEHNGIPVALAEKERCCGMPKLELGDLEAVARAKEANIPVLAKLVDEGWDIVAPVPSCVLMFKQELPLMFPDDPDVAKVKQAIFDPFEYLMLRHKEGKLKTDFKKDLGSVSYHVPCHLRVQNIGLKTREALSLVPNTKIDTIERCSGHDGTYAVKSEFHKISMKICKPVVSRVEQAKPDHYSSDCPMAGHQIENGLQGGMKPEHPMSLLRQAYAI
ncbi:MAG: Fe-S oxidoreductase [Candidatus Muproteobacteria bacterium RIFCSPHIGHO2_12_FULL_60_33]|uniref:Fe-S oxidoreductase n=1 Tax=Candidatus Muproteobacteria bacterium RIFCSPLOWO2_01_FULL_60_18 TaxID=1817768 RepID=A0A1F6TXN9_9PROT|nr:MAG: Fe-S oxidoreductase [Candidatus Muproteobacteria bacterium RIFCSPLOWO2_01_FULL_60_18]OGI50594.1 MAG: Fe-S oxidoreductase [Candidatus Muproteobacteria bacterium RIFCSPHIGHO2_01_60_12]OGI53843.1 MAG: Fe-S oxidoreductase [Candidatus Muproteobacteria bacterium RIFCSPHIGHO2_02_FULL_60_13]OGI56298.1 MAG: Fe-S oxidoreductase [Candidatus Muproteobacteria bacterium RIFCSPHIGHO2_12_FULL_60_33]OGI58498.1 MAG: Fe-S oxidoreductase [Candidatus Muproteobacteria bacterium RIFCSPHIGHO2_01_FULL_61_200]